MIKKIKGIISAKITSFYWKKHRSITIRHKNEKGIERFAELYGKPTSVQGKGEALFLYTMAKKMQKVPGNYAECGVYKGFGATFICENKGAKILHLFDTFNGFPTGQGKNDKKLSLKKYHQGSLAISLETVKKTLSSYKNLVYHTGVFSETCKEVENHKFAMVHIDFDMYESMKQAIEFFYPRINPGGIMILHDYRFFQGVQKAANEFFADKTETIICWNENQGIAFKIGV